MPLRVTVCEFHDDPVALSQDWVQLAAHVKAEASDLVLLPEMPFHPWFARTRPYVPGVWQAVLEAHTQWHKRLNELAPATIMGTQPVEIDSRRLNEGFVFESTAGYRPAHQKYYLPDEDGYWEASWYQRGEGTFVPIESGGLKAGFLICTELWFMEQARAYGRAGVHLIVNPRATERASVDTWLLAGRTAAIVAGAFALSSNRVEPERDSSEFGGQGWVVGPEGEVLGITSQEHPFVTVDIDIAQAELAKTTYPRYVLE